MQEIRDMLEVSKGIYEPTEECYILDESAWFKNNTGFGYVRDVETKRVLLVFKLRGTEDIVEFTRRRCNTPVGYRCGIPDLGDCYLGGLFDGI